MTPQLQTMFLGRRLDSPLVLPAGILGMTSASFRFARRAGFGLVTSKSYTLAPRSGHASPVVASYAGGMLNAMGLCNPGIHEGLREVNQFVEESGDPIITSIFGTSAAEFCELVRVVNDSASTFVELNLSCPNVMDEFGFPLAASKDEVARIVEAVRQISRLPVIAKLSPNALRIPDIARAAQQAGADALCLINTLGPGLLVDIHLRRPILKNTYGGISGAAVRPLAQKIVHECAAATGLPVIGMGGVSTGDEAVEMLICGARLVGVGSALYDGDMSTIAAINQGILAYLQRHDFAGPDAIPRLESAHG